MLVKNFYTILSFDSSDQHLEATLLFNPDHEVYLGHFPGQPVVPGVIQLQIVKELFEQHLKRKLKLVSMLQAKFLMIIVPDKQMVLISISYKQTDESSFQVDASISANQQTATKLKAIYSLNESL
ncbi:MAG: 3-hydroxyacyl-ACP dehydratase [Bacteroidetes bacterium CG18_big_fil_WC_8_21_14_2_50_41_14]|nr:MAG: 3-hydroxyacyl-ACP dehydratase [Bacteroidetes bacterium CG18_big_fil_WC_8_21_14_2_50_41_14]PJB57423.1 MAG: 3-hydroxyacyl-ACP dehydratase [Bacteroidetes bacterium CG_4_9_14_3_um_filter_41_19]